MLPLIGYGLACLMGTILGLVGAGGSILAVPILVYFMGVDPVTATGYSLLIVGLTALIGAIRYIKKSQIDIKTALIFAAPSILSVYATRLWLLPSIPENIDIGSTFSASKDTIIMVLFSLMTLASSFFMIRNGKTIKNSSTTDIKKNSGAFSLSIVIDGAVVGLFTGIVGAGGGFLTIPALVLLTDLEMKIAVGSSLLIIALKSLIGFVGDLQSGIYIDTPLILQFIAATSIGILIGTFLSNKISAQHLKKAFGWFTLFKVPPVV